MFASICSHSLSTSLLHPFYNVQPVRSFKKEASVVGGPLRCSSMAMQNRNWYISRSLTSLPPGELTSYRCDNQTPKHTKLTGRRNILMLFLPQPIARTLHPAEGRTTQAPRQKYHTKSTFRLVAAKLSIGRPSLGPRKTSKRLQWRATGPTQPIGSTLFAFASRAQPAPWTTVQIAAATVNPPFCTRAPYDLWYWSKEKRVYPRKA